MMYSIQYILQEDTRGSSSMVLVIHPTIPEGSTKLALLA